MLTPETIKLIEEMLKADPLTSDQSIALQFQIHSGSVNAIRKRLLRENAITETFMRRGTDSKVYSLRKPSGRKDIIQPNGQNKEYVIQDQVAKYLSSRGHTVRLEVEVKSVIGKVDILTEYYLYEIKQTLTRDSVFEAIGQTLLYQQALRFPGKLAIIGGGYQRGVISFLPFVKDIGIEVFLWKGSRLLLLSDFLEQQGMNSNYRKTKPTQ